MISFDQFRKALDRQRIVMSNLQAHALLADLQPNPQCGFGVNGTNVWGDRDSIDKVRQWQHDSVEVVPHLRKTLIAEREVRATTPPPSDHAYCIGCGTYPKGPYTCQTCKAADNFEGPIPHISDWPE